MNRRIVKGAQATLHEILASQLEMIQTVALNRPLDKEEIQRLELLLKIYDKLPIEQQLNAPGITISVIKPTQKELKELLKIAEKD